MNVTTLTKQVITITPIGSDFQVSFKTNLTLVPNILILVHSVGLTVIVVVAFIRVTNKL